MKSVSLSPRAREVVASIKATAAANRQSVADGTSAHDGAFSLSFGGFNRKIEAQGAVTAINRMRGYDAYVTKEGPRAWGVSVNH